MVQKLVIAGIVMLIGISGSRAISRCRRWTPRRRAAGTAQGAGSGDAVAPLKIDGPNYLPSPELPGSVDVDGTIDPREFCLDGMPYPGDPADPGFCSAPGSGLPCDPPTP